MSLSDLTGEGELTKLANAIPSNFMTDIRASLTKAKDLEKQNAKDTAIWGEIQTTAQIVDINCQDQTAKEYMKRLASFGYLNFPDQWQKKSAVFFGKCYWGKYNNEDPQTLTTRVPTVTSPPENTTIGKDNEGNLLINEKGYRYSLYPDMTLDRLIGKNEAGQIVALDILQFMKDTGHINQQIADDMKSFLKAAQQMELVNPKDPAIIMDINRAANVLNANCNNDTQAKGYMQALASYTYRHDPEAWPNNKKIYLDGPCYWGEKFIVSQEHQIINLDYGLYVYKGVGYDELLAPQNLDKLKPLYVQPDSFGILKSDVTTARDLESTSPNDQKLADSLLGAAYYVANKCDQSADAKEYMRLLVSLVYEKHPNIWNGIHEYARECYLLNYD